MIVIVRDNGQGRGELSSLYLLLNLCLAATCSSAYSIFARLRAPDGAAVFAKKFAKLTLLRPGDLILPTYERVSSKAAAPCGEMPRPDSL